MRSVSILASLWMWLLALAAPAPAFGLDGSVLVDGQRRIALVIAIPVDRGIAVAQNDADAVVAALEQAGFETTHLNDPAGPALAAALADLRDRPTDIGLVYYLGPLHRSDAAGRLELMPATGAGDATVARIVDAVATAETLGVVVLDSPWSDLGPADIEAVPDIDPAILDRVVVIAGIAWPPIAADLPSPLADSWVRAIGTPGISLVDAQEMIARRLRFTTSGQVALTSGGTGPAGALLFLPAHAPEVASATEQLFWETVRDGGGAADFEAYLAAYPEGAFAALARARLDGLATDDGTAPAIPNPIPFGLAERRAIQRDLRRLGLYAGTIDGIFGRGTEAAIARFQRDQEEEPTGWLTDAQRGRLRLAAAAVPDPAPTPSPAPTASAAPPPEPEVAALPASRFGALAVGDGRFGLCVDLGQASDARSCALAQCGPACAVMALIRRGQCFAYAESRLTGIIAGVGIGSSTVQASDNALRACRQNAAQGGCAVLAVRCQG